MTPWPSVPLGECCEIVSGSTPSTADKSLWTGDICWATPKDLSALTGSYISSTPRTLTRKGLDTCSARVLPPGSVLFSSRAPIGHVAINTVPMATNQGFKSFLPSEGRVHAEYLAQWLRKTRPYLESLGNGATFKELSKAVIERVELPLPPIEEQRRIAAILDKADELRAKRRAALAHLDSLTQSIFLDMFSDPASGNTWPVSVLGEILVTSLRNGLSPATAGDVDGQVLTLSAITGRRFRSESLKAARFSVDPALHSPVSLKDFLICRGNGNRNLVGVGRFPTIDMPTVAFPDTMIAAQINTDEMNPRMLEMMWSLPFVRRQIDSVARTTNGTFKVNQEGLAGVRLIKPPMSEQLRFAEVVTRLESERVSHDRSGEQTDALFESLQQRAFSGTL